jgi:prolyl-tRNA synthetase
LLKDVHPWLWESWNLQQDRQASNLQRNLHLSRELPADYNTDKVVSCYHFLSGGYYMTIVDYVNNIYQTCFQVFFTVLLRVYMRQSQLFTKTRKEAPKDEVSKNAELLIRAGFIHKEMAGVYAFLPLGLRVLNNIVEIIRDEMNKIGGQEVALTALQEKTLWQKTDRWDDEKYDIWFKTFLKNGTELGLATTHEEPLTAIMKNFVASYRDLPKAVYQFQTKFRNEVRAKSGIMRGREFLMKDMYSFSRDQKEHDAFYQQAKAAYVRIFERLGLGAVTYPTFALGGTFSKYSEEFQTISSAGEDTIYVDEAKKIAVNKETFTPEVLVDLGLDKKNLVEKKGIEVGNIFNLGTKFSEPLELVYSDEKGEKQTVIMGCYGMGPSRIMGTIVEVLADEKGIVWPKEIAPFTVHLIEMKGSEAVSAAAEKLYRDLNKKGISVLWDDRDTRAGEKFADADLIGIPYRVVISEKTIKENKVELKLRTEDEAELVDEAALFQKIQKIS